MPSTTCFNVVRGKRLRVTRLDECGNPPGDETPNSFVVTKGFISVGLSGESEAGTDITQMNADGDLCVNDRSKDQFKRWNVTMEFCDVDPALLEIVSNVALETDWDGDVVGVRGFEGAKTGGFALELWAGIPGEDCVPGEDARYGYLLLPFVNPGTLGDITIENDVATFTVEGFTRGSGGWGVGPFDVVPTDAQNTPGPLSVPMGPSEHHLLRITNIAPPDPVCGAQAMPVWEPV